MRILTRSAYMQFLAMYVVYLAGDHHLDHMRMSMSRRDNRTRTLLHMMYTRNRTCF